MQVYVHETNLVYQYVIDKYEKLFNDASGSTQIVANKYIVSDNTAVGLTFVNAWLDSSVEGQAGVTRANARWRIFYGTDITVTGGTYSNGTGIAQFKNSTGGTFNVTGFARPSGVDTEVQYNNSGDFGAGSFFTTNKSSKVDVTYELGLVGDGTNQGLLKLYCEAGTPHYVGLKGPNHSGGSSYTLQLPNTLPAVTNQILESNASGTLSWVATPSGSTYTNWFATGDNQSPAVPIDVVDTFTLKFTGFITSGGAGIATDSAISANEMTIALINNGGSPTDKTFYRGDGEWQTPTDTELTGGTYNNSTGILQLTNSDASTVTLTGFTTGATEDTFVTGITYNQLSKTLTLGLNDGVDFNATGFAAEVTGGTYSGGSITLNNNDGTTSQVTGLEILTHIGLVNDTNVSINGTTIDSVNTTTYKGAFFDYVINDGTNYRAGTVQSVWSATQVQFNDSSTVDIGTTTNFSWGMTLSGGNALLQANILGGTWDIRIIKHII